MPRELNTVRLDAPALSRTLGEIAELAQQGAGSELASRWTADAARAVGDGRDRLAVLEQLAQRVKGAVAFAPDEYGGENLQALEETLEGRGAGDCDDYAIALLSLGRRAGLRGGVAVYHEYPPGDADPIAVHVLPVFEDPATPGKWVPVELTREGVPFGEKPAMRNPGHWSVTELQEREQGRVGFLEFLAPVLGAAASIFGTSSAASSASKTAKENRKAEVGVAAARADEAKATAGATIAVSQTNRANLQDALAFGREALSTLFKVALVGAAVTVVTSFAGRRRAPARRAA